MKTLRQYGAMMMLLAVVFVVSCSRTATQSPDVSGNVRKSLDQAGLKDVSVSQDRDRGVVTLTGNVASDSEKSQAQSIAASEANGQVVSNQVAVVPPGASSDAKSINSDTDAAIDKNLDAALIKAKLHKAVSYKVKNGVVTLTGTVISEGARARAEKIAAGIDKVQQVVNELQIKGQKATTTANR